MADELQPQKMIMAIVGPADADDVLHALVAHEFEATRVGSAGGFLRRGNVTLFVGVPEANLEAALQVIRDACQSKPEPDQHRATLFVMNAPEWLQL